VKKTQLKSPYNRVLGLLTHREYKLYHIPADKEI